MKIRNIKLTASVLLAMVATFVAGCVRETPELAVHADRTIAFYRIDTEEQYEALLDYQLENLVK